MGTGFRGPITPEQSTDFYTNGNTVGTASMSGGMAIWSNQAALSRDLRAAAGGSLFV